MKACLTLARVALVGVLCLALSGCFFAPGRFTSSLDLRRDGTFTYRYEGELAYVFPEDQGAADIDLDRVQCSGPEGQDPSACPEERLVGLRAQSIADRAMREAQAAELAVVTGYDAYNRPANEALARRLAEYPGWQQVTFVRPGVFAVVYEMTGRIDRDFVFPTIPDMPLSLPFVIVRPDRAGTVTLSAPALAPGALRQRLLQARSEGTEVRDLLLFDRVAGTFTLTMDDGLVSGNADRLASDGQGRRVAVWMIDGATMEIPQATIDMERRQ